MSSGSEPVTTSRPSLRVVLRSRTTSCSTPAMRRTPIALTLSAVPPSSRVSRKVIRENSSTLSALCMFLSRPAFGDDRVAAGMAISKPSIAPGFTTSFQNASGGIAGASFTRVTSTFVVEAVYSWMFDEPAIVTRAVSMPIGDRACAVGPAVNAVAARTAIGAVRSSWLSDMKHLVGMTDVRDADSTIEGNCRARHAPRGFRARFAGTRESSRIHGGFSREVGTTPQPAGPLEATTGCAATGRRSRTGMVHASADARMGAAVKMLWPFGMRAAYERDVARLVTPSAAIDGEPVAEQELERLPLPVQRYLRLSGVVGGPPVHTFAARMHGRIRSGPGARWIPIVAEQNNVLAP